MTRLLLIRHGETDWNHEGRWHGQLDVPLNARGEQQAERLAELLEDQPVQAVYSSDLQRAVETARRLANDKSVPLVLDHRLREIDQGKWQGLRVADIMEMYGPEYQSGWRDSLDGGPPGGETARQVQERALQAVAEIVRRHPDETVAVVSHGFTIAMVRLHFIGLPIQEVRPLIPKNGEIAVLDVPNDFSV
jgi:broad specificity phosphatase PhoE